MLFLIGHCCSVCMCGIVMAGSLDRVIFVLILKLDIAVQFVGVVLL